MTARCPQRDAKHIRRRTVQGVACATGKQFFKHAHSPDLSMKTANSNAAKARRTNVTLLPDRTRVLIRPFNLASSERAGKICAQVLAFSDREVHALLEQVQAEFGERHLKIHE